MEPLFSLCEENREKEDKDARGEKEHGRAHSPCLYPRAALVESRTRWLVLHGEIRKVGEDTADIEKEQEQQQKEQQQENLAGVEMR